MRTTHEAESASHERVEVCRSGCVALRTYVGRRVAVSARLCRLGRPRRARAAAGLLVLVCDHLVRSEHGGGRARQEINESASSVTRCTTPAPRRPHFAAQHRPGSAGVAPPPTAHSQSLPASRGMGRHSWGRPRRRRPRDRTRPRSGRSRGVGGSGREWRGGQNALALPTSEALPTSHSPLANHKRILDVLTPQASNDGWPLTSPGKAT